MITLDSCVTVVICLLRVQTVRLRASEVTQGCTRPQATRRFKKKRRPMLATLNQGTSIMDLAKDGLRMWATSGTGMIVCEGRRGV
jgi:hypothetical protein